MIDEILIINEQEAVIVYTNKPSVTIAASSKPKLIELLTYLTTEKTQYNDEITLLIDLDEAA